MELFLDVQHHVLGRALGTYSIREGSHKRLSCGLSLTPAAVEVLWLLYQRGFYSPEVVSFSLKLTWCFAMLYFLNLNFSFSLPPFILLSYYAVSVSSSHSPLPFPQIHCSSMMYFVFSHLLFLVSLRTAVKWEPQERWYCKQCRDFWKKMCMHVEPPVDFCFTNTGEF